MTLRMFDEPWYEIRDPQQRSALLSELHKEVAKESELRGSAIAPIAARQDCDDVMFAEKWADGSGFKFGRCFVVHLTWSGRPEPEGYPSVAEYPDFDTWVDQCYEPDRAEWEG